MSDNSAISPLAFIGENVELGKDVKIGPYAVILGPVKIGDGVYVGAGAQIGAPAELSNLPQNAAWAGDILGAGVEIGAGSVIREGAVIHQGSYRPTRIGQGCWILNRAYVAHDVQIGDNTTVSAGVSIGGHCVIGPRVNIGMNAVVHQRRIIGAGAMVGMGSPVARDVPPFAKVYGSPLRIQGVNAVGLQRAGVEDTQVAHDLWKAYQAGNYELEGFQAEAEVLTQAVSLWREADAKVPAKVN